MRKRMVSVLLCVVLMLGAVPVLGIPAQAVTYRITYNKNTSNTVENMPETTTGIADDMTLIAEEAPTRFRYTFLGWSSDKNATEPDSDYLPGNDIILTSDLTLYAVWAWYANSNVAGYGYELDLTAGTSNAVELAFSGQQKWYRVRPTQSQSHIFWSTGGYDPNITLYDSRGTKLDSNDDNPYTTNDYSFRLSYSLESGSTYYIAVSGRTLYTSDRFWAWGHPGSSYKTVTYHTNIPGNDEVFMTQRQYKVTTDIPWRIPAYEKHNFLGWSTSASWDGDGLLLPGETLPQYESYDLYAIWEEPYVIHSGATLNYYGQLEYGIKEELYSFTPKSSGTYTLIVKDWTDHPLSIPWVYDSSFNTLGVNTSDHDDALFKWTETYQMTAGKKYYITVSNLYPNTIPLDKTYDDVNDYSYYENVDYTIQVVKSATLSYDANGGSGAPSSQSGSYSYKVSSVKPTRSGYTFDGWSTSKTLTTDDLYYEPGDTILVNEPTTLYAVWSKIGNAPYWGDVNGDYHVNVRDIVLISKHIADIETLTEEQACFGDVNLDGKTNASDVTQIAQYVAGTIPEFPCESVAGITVVPAKTQYTKGEALQTSGTIILVQNRDSAVSYALTDNISISGYNPNTVGTQTLTVTYRGLELTFTVTVKDKTYTLSYDANGGSGEPDPQTGSTSYLIPMVIPTCFGRNFTGWYTIGSSGGRTYYYPGEEITIETDTVLKANWSGSGFINDADFFGSVIKYPGQMKYQYHTQIESGKYVIYSYGDEDPEGYLYDSSGKELARNDDGGNGTNFRITYNLVAGTTYYIGLKYHSSTETGKIDCYFGPVYTVSYNANGGSGAPASQEKDYKKNLSLSSSTPSTAKSYTITYNANGGSVSPSFKTVNCTFSKWNTKPDGTGTSYHAGATYTNDASVTLYAEWTNPTADTLAEPTKTGYTFVGWYTASTGGTEITSRTKITANMPLYAHWTPNTYTVRFNGNGATSGSMSNQSFTYDASQNLTANAFKRTYTVTYNYNGATGGNSKSTDTATATFNGWATSASGSKVYNDKQSIKNLTVSGTVDLYANWTLGTVTLPTPTRNGYTFDGWYTSLDGGSRVASGTKISKDTPIFAHWSKVTAVGCDILSAPNKTAYIYKEKTDMNGLVLNIRYSDGTVKTVADLNQMSFNGLSTNIVGTKTITVTCEGVSADFDITVRYTWWQNLIRFFLFGWLWY